jgi:hypothetical protein
VAEAICADFGSPYGPGTGRGDGACPPWEAGCSLPNAGTGSSHHSSGGDGMLIGHLGIEPTGPTAGMYRQMTRPYKGGITSFMAGMFDSLFSSADLSMDLACVLCALNAGGHSAEDWYKQWLAAHHVPTGGDSWYGAGIGSADVISLLLGAGAGTGAGDAAGEAAEDAGTSVGRELTTYYPPNRGFFGESTSQVLRAGTRVDRYGREGGTFVSPEGTPVPMRALPPGATARAYNTYEVVNPIEVRAGTVSPWSGQLGLGTQYELPDSVGNLIQNGYLKLAEDGG